MFDVGVKREREGERASALACASIRTLRDPSHASASFIVRLGYVEAANVQVSHLSPAPRMRSTRRRALYLLLSTPLSHGHSPCTVLFALPYSTRYLTPLPAACHRTTQPATHCTVYIMDIGLLLNVEEWPPVVHGIPLSHSHSHINAHVHTHAHSHVHTNTPIKTGRDRVGKERVEKSCPGCAAKNHIRTTNCKTCGLQLRERTRPRAATAAKRKAAARAAAVAAVANRSRANSPRAEHATDAPWRICNICDARNHIRVLLCWNCRRAMRPAKTVAATGC